MRQRAKTTSWILEVLLLAAARLLEILIDAPAPGMSSNHYFQQWLNPKVRFQISPGLCVAHKCDGEGPVVRRKSRHGVAGRRWTGDARQRILGTLENLHNFKRWKY